MQIRIWGEQSEQRVGLLIALALQGSQHRPGKPLVPQQLVDETPDLVPACNGLDRQDLSWCAEFAHELDQWLDGFLPSQQNDGRYASDLLHAISPRSRR